MDDWLIGWFTNKVQDFFKRISMNRVAAQCNIATALKVAAAYSLPFISTTRVCAKFKEVLKLTSA